MYNLSKEESDRIRIVKFICMVFVVYIHSHATEIVFSDGTVNPALPMWLQMLEDMVTDVISSCGVPAFFLVSSILLFKTERRYLDTLRKKAKTILLPYLVWNTFWIAVFIILQSFPFTGAFFSGKNTPVLQCSRIEWLRLYGIGKGAHYPHCYPLWFMRDLMVVLLAFPLINKLASAFPKVMLIVGISLTLLPVNFLYKTALAWFIIGAAIVKLQIHITVLDRVPIGISSCVYLLGVIITFLLKINFVSGVFIFVGIAFWARVSKEIYDNEATRRVFLWLSKWTFMVYVLHELTLSAIMKLCMRFLPTTPLFMGMEYAIIPIFVIALCVIIGAKFQNLAPKLYALTTGER